MRLVDHYPETLRDIYDKIEEVIAQAGANPAAMDMALHVTEWVRKNWSGRTLIPSWWGAAEAMPAAEESDILPGVVPQIDPLRTMRGRELSDVTLGILLTDPNARVAHPCHLATAIAARVEGEWSRTQLYIPKGSAVDRAIRDSRIWTDFRGFGTIGEVVTSHKVSQSVIYNIFRRIQKKKKENEEPPLPGF